MNADKRISYRRISALNCEQNILDAYRSNSKNIKICRGFSRMNADKRRGYPRVSAPIRSKKITKAHFTAAMVKEADL